MGEQEISSPIEIVIESKFGPLIFFCLYYWLTKLPYTTPRMFADDTSVSYASNSVEEPENILSFDLNKLNSWLTTNRLGLNIAEIKFMIIIGSRQKVRLTYGETKYQDK